MAEERIQYVGSEQPEVLSIPTPEKGPSEPTLESQGEQLQEKTGEKYSQILSQVKTVQTPLDQTGVLTDADTLAQVQDAETAVMKLVELAQTKGVPHAVAVAQKLNDFFVLDRMHDELADKFYEALKAKGLV